MVVTIMPLLNSTLLQQFKDDFPFITLHPGDDFTWRCEEKLILYNAKTANSADLILHELGHASLEHQKYLFDVELLRMESEAWQWAVQAAVRYNITIDNNFIADNLDTYREWLQKRSSCPNCEQTGLQRQKNAYQCLNCRHSWRVNDARRCQLRRFTLSS